LSLSFSNIDQLSPKPYDDINDDIDDDYDDDDIDDVIDFDIEKNRCQSSIVDDDIELFASYVFLLY